MSYQATETHGGNLNAYFSVKEASLKRLHVVWFQFYDILEKANYTYKKRSVVKKKKSVVVRGVGMEGRDE